MSSFIRGLNAISCPLHLPQEPDPGVINSNTYAPKTLKNSCELSKMSHIIRILAAYLFLKYLAVFLENDVIYLL